MEQIKQHNPRFFNNVVRDIIYANRIPHNEITYDNFIKYESSCPDWFQNEVILISFIDKLVKTNFQKYENLIRDLHSVLIKSIMNSFEYFNKHYPVGCSNDGGFRYGTDYMMYLMYNTDLTKLPPTQKDGFMYLCYHCDLYTIGNLTNIINNDLTDKIVINFLKYIENDVLPDSINLQNHISQLNEQAVATYTRNCSNDDACNRPLKRKRYT